jgi:predicted nucleic acid-binding protein
LSTVFDTEALLSFYLGEPGGKTVQERLEEVVRGDRRGYLNVVNLTEFYYILYRKSRGLAEEKERNLRGYGVEIVPVEDKDLWRHAAETKASHSLSLADAFAVATAKVKEAELLVGRDAEFDGVDVSLERTG